MRATRWARWASCALAISICIPASADRIRRTVASCTSFDQSDPGETNVGFTVRNACSMPVDCSVSWRLVCAPEAKKRRAAHPASANFSLDPGTSQRTEASAAACGDDSWVIDSVRWSCQASKD